MVGRRKASMVWGRLAFVLLLGAIGCRVSSPSASPFERLPFRQIWRESFSAAWSSWAPEALACGEAGEGATACLQALRPTLPERVTEEAALRKEALAIDVPYVANILGGYAQRPEQAAILLILAMAESREEPRRARLRAAFEAIPDRFQEVPVAFRSAVRPLPHPGSAEDPRRWAQYYLSQEWALLRAAVAAWRPPSAEEIGCRQLVPGEDLCPLVANLRSPQALPAWEDRIGQFFRGAFDYADAFARSERLLQRDPARVRALLSEMLAEARGRLIPLERETARQRLVGEGPSVDPLEAAWDEVERMLFDLK